MTPALTSYTSANLDSDGALNSLAGTDTRALFFFSAFRDGNGIHLGTQPDRSGRFRATFTGAATVTGFGTTGLTVIDPNTIEFDCDMIGNKWLDFTPTSFPIKVTIVKTTDLAAHAAGEIFAPAYLATLPTGGCIRTMTWNSPNQSAMTDWSQYPAATAQKWSPVPFSTIVNLSTAKSADPWITLPYAVSDSFVTTLAEYMRDNLPTARKLRVELSNEIWNTGTFSATGLYFKGLAESVWGVPDGYSGPIWMHYAGKRFAQIMQIFNTVFVGQTHRVIGVIGGQAANTGLSAAFCDATSWQTYEPGSYVRPSTLAKELAIAPYINWVGGATAQGNNIKTQLDISHAAAVAYIKGMIPASLAQAKGWIDASAAIAADRGLRLTMYEYNNHYDLFACEASTLWTDRWFNGGLPVAGALDAFLDATYSQEMADAQDELRDYFKAQNGSLMAFFVDTGRASRFGTWGAKTHNEHNSPIWNDLQSWHAANTRWWAQ